MTTLSKGQKATLSVIVRVVESAHAPVPTYAAAWSDETDSNPDDNHVYLYTTVLADPNAPLARCAGVANGTIRVTCSDWFQMPDGGQAHMNLEPAPDFSGVLSAQVIENFCDWTDSCREIRGTFVNGTLVRGTQSLVVGVGYAQFPQSYEFQVIAAPLETVSARVPPICRGIFMGTGMGFEVCTPSAGTGSHNTGTAAVGSFQGTLIKI
ncbi:MAG TPA: hypothetical protein VND22_04930 [Actinomycetota bacterium]|nr:hypothetical protein [Actinomycetota bacterium]